MSLEYALITDSSLPNAVKESDHYVSVDKDQWLDLIDYSESLVKEDSSQKILFLIVAKGTPEQEAADEERRLKEKAEKERLKNDIFEKEKAEEERLAREALETSAKENLRKKSKSIFNALYHR